MVVVVEDQGRGCWDGALERTGTAGYIHCMTIASCKLVSRPVERINIAMELKLGVEKLELHEGWEGRELVKYLRIQLGRHSAMPSPSRSVHE